VNELLKKLKTADLFTCEIDFLKETFDRAEYPWEILPQIGSLVVALVERGIPGYTRYSENILVGEGVRMAATVTIEGKAILGPGCELRPGAFLRGNIIAGPDCVIGNSSELKNCILLKHVQVPHYNYVGDSVLGNYAHMGAGSICSNLRSDGKNVVIHGERDYETGLRKVGAFIADHGDIGCGCVLNPGSVIGKNTSVYPLTAVRGVMPENVIVKSLTDIVRREDR